MVIILKLIVCKDQQLLVWRNSFLVLYFGLDIANGVRYLDVQGDGLDSVMQGGLHNDPDLHGKDLFGLGGLGTVAAHNCVDPNACLR